MNHRNEIDASVVEQLQLFEGLRESARVVRVGEEEAPVHRRPGGDSKREPFDGVHVFTAPAPPESGRYSLVQHDVALQGAEKLPGASAVEVQGGQRVAPSTRQHQEVLPQRDASPPEGVQLREGQRERPQTCGGGGGGDV